MKTIDKSFVQRALKDQRGQVLPLVALGMVLFMGMAGMTIDVGQAYIVRSQLQSAANAAALASATSVYQGPTAVLLAAVPLSASQYDASGNTSPSTIASDITAGTTVSKGANYSPRLPGVTTTATTTCVTATLAGTTCANSHTDQNVVRITESASVPTFFMRVFGINSLSVGATATAYPNGTVTPYNIAIILDATPSMNQTDSNCGGVSAEQCALNGIRQLMSTIDPCANLSLGSCAVTSSNALVRISLFSFPNVSASVSSSGTVTGDVTKDYTCGGTPQGQPYTLPVQPPSTGAAATAGYSPIKYTHSGSSTYTATYQVTPVGAGNADANGFFSDYFNTAYPSNMYPSSILSEETGYGTTNGCLTQPNTNYGSSTGNGSNAGVTYFAGAIYAAQAALQAEKMLSDSITGLSSKNVIIFVSDGQANTYYGQFPPATSTESTTSSLGEGGITTNTYSTTKNLINSTYGVYPDWHDPCQQAMMAAQYAVKNGTIVYGVAYGSETYGCTDNTVVTNTTAYNETFSSASAILPCTTIENIAQDWKHFYREGSALDCDTAAMAAYHNAGLNSLNGIFGSIGTSLGPGARLISNTTN